MPELPEVETIVRNLREGKDSPPLVGRVIASAELLWERSLAEPGAEAFRNLIGGQTIRQVSRRGKFIVLKLNSHTLLIHLRMSGDLRLESKELQGHQPKPLQVHDRVVFYLDGGWRLAFNDARKFGRLWLLKDPSVVLGKLGPEPLDPALTSQHFYLMLSNRNRQLKPLLLDQTFLAGLGNIYTDEALHLAGLHPAQLSSRLTLDQSDRLLSAIRSVVAEGIRRNGASIDWVYRGGDFQNSFRVYHRTGQPCPVCHTPIERRLIGQRGTHTCPVCQPFPEER